VGSSFFSSFLSFWPVVPLLGIVIFFHELGHFLAAKWRGVTVIKFSLGMGPEMLGFSAGGTRYCLSWVPLGGFVQMAGDSLNDDSSMPEGGPEKFLTHPWYGRLLIAIAGPAANLVTAYFVVVAMFVVGIQRPDYVNMLGGLSASSAPYAAGVREGDQFTRLAGHSLTRWHELLDVVDKLDANTPAVLELARAGQTYTVTIPAGQAGTWIQSFVPPPLPATVGAVSPAMPAYRAGVLEGDRVVAVGGQPVLWFEDIVRNLKGRADQPVRFRIERNGKPYEVDLTPMRVDPEHPDSRDGFVGISAVRGLLWVEKTSLAAAVPAAFSGTAGLVKMVYKNLWMTLSRPLYYRQAVGGPIFIGQMAKEAARQGLDSYLYLLAMINLAIMSFNLLPVPLLDGGHIVLALIEGARRRAMTGRSYVNFQKVGLVFVVTLFVFIFSQDILRPIQRLRAIDKVPRETTTVDPTHR
jgi:regulator of sigma E protease